MVVVTLHPVPGEVEEAAVLPYHRPEVTEAPTTDDKAMTATGLETDQVDGTPWGKFNEGKKKILINYT